MTLIEELEERRELAEEVKKKARSAQRKWINAIDHLCAEITQYLGEAVNRGLLQVEVNALQKPDEVLKKNYKIKRLTIVEPATERSINLEPGDSPNCAGFTGGVEMTAAGSQKKYQLAWHKNSDSWSITPYTPLRDPKKHSQPLTAASVEEAVSELLRPSAPIADLRKSAILDEQTRESMAGSPFKHQSDGIRAA